MLPRDRRISREGDIVKVLGRGRRFFGRFITLRVLAGSSQKTRFGFIVSKKVHSKPVKRNLVKRRLRAATVELIPKLKNHLDILISAKAQAVGIAYRDLLEELCELLQKAGVIKNNP